MKSDKLLRPSHSQSRIGRGHLALMCVLGGVVCAALLVPSPVTTVKARAYGKKKKKYGYGAVIARCNRGCGQTASVLEGCRRQLLHGAKGQCQKAFKAELASCTGSKSACRKQARAVFKGCLGDVARQVKEDRKLSKPGACTKCCRKTKGGGSCLDYFADSRFSGSSRYGHRLSCVDSSGGSPGGAFVDGISDRLRAQAVAWMRALVRPGG